MIILGLDPGLGTTGWGVIRKEGNRLSHIDNGEITTDAKLPLANRLVILDEKLSAVLDHFRPDYAAVEEVFVNKNPQSTLKLGQARGVVLLGAARNRTPVTEYATRLVKKSVVGTGKADQEASLTGSVAVSVVSVMANGNLVLRGEKQVALTEGAEIIQVSGIIRPEDVSAINTVQSRRMANAQISYRGSGDLASTAKAGWGTSALMKLWPF